jgi:hypothetical protein
MSRPGFRRFAAIVPFAIAAAVASTDSADSKTKSKEVKSKPKAEQSSTAPGDAQTAGRPSQLGNYSDWGVFLARGEKSKICYALATPKDRAPAGLKRDPAYVFISSRPGENVREEISIIMGFPTKEDGAHAEVAGASFALIAKGANAWIKNPAEEIRFIDALKKGSKLVVKATSLKGHVTTDSYSLAGLSQALERVQKECP